VMNLKTWNSLPKDVQAAMEAINEGFSVRAGEIWDSHQVKGGIEYGIKEHGMEIVKWPEADMKKAMELMQRYSWPGNVRELENCVERAVVLCRDEILTERHFQLEHESTEKSSSFGLEGVGPGMTLREMEKRLIISTLTSESNNRTRASEILGISVRTLRNKLNEYTNEGVKIP